MAKKMEYGKTYVDVDARYLKSIKKYQAQIITRWVNEYGAKETDFVFFRQAATKAELLNAISDAQQKATARFTVLADLVRDIDE